MFYLEELSRIFKEVALQTQDFKLINPKLKCGCVLGDDLCPTGKRLWENVQRLYERAQSDNSPSAWNVYSAAQREYFNHFNEMGG